METENEGGYEAARWMETEGGLVERNRTSLNYRG